MVSFDEDELVSGAPLSGEKATAASDSDETKPKFSDMDSHEVIDRLSEESKLAEQSEQVLPERAENTESDAEEVQDRPEREDEEHISDDGSESNIDLAAGYDPVEYLTENQILAATRMVNFPNQSLTSIAESIGVTRNTLYNWRQDEHFQDFLNQIKQSFVEKTIGARAQRNAYVFDAVTDELYERLEKPTNDPAELARIIGDSDGNYTSADLFRYRQRFVSNMPVKDLFQIWNSLEDKVRGDEEMRGTGEDYDTLLHQIQKRYEKVQITKRKSRSFRQRTGFDYDVDFNEEEAVTIYAERAKDEDQTEEPDIIDVEVVETKEEENLLDSFAID